MVGDAGNDRYPYDGVWLTDGYGDYVGHYLRAMAADPELAPRQQNHLLRSSSVVRQIAYAPQRIAYTTYGNGSQEILRVAFEPTEVRAGGTKLVRLEAVSDLYQQEGYTFHAPGDVPGVLRIRHDFSGEVQVTGEAIPRPPAVQNQIVTGNQNSSIQIKLAAKGAAGKTLTYFLIGPYRAKLSGSAPELTYTPETDYLGSDLLSFWVSDGELESATAQVTINIARPNLARWPGAEPFTTEDPQTGGTGVFPVPALADGNLHTSINAAYDSASPREVSLGILWKAPQGVRQIVFRHGSISSPSGYFDAPPRLQVTADGRNWRDASGYTVAPSGYAANKRSGMVDFIFTFPTNVSVKGVRITGEVGKTGAAQSHFPRVRELEAYSALATSRGPELEYQPGDASVALGQAVMFTVRPKAMTWAVYQRQKSTDQGAHWENLRGETSSFYRISSTRLADNGAMLRCVVSNGTSPDAVSKAATLTVVR